MIYAFGVALSVCLVACRILAQVEEQERRFVTATVNLRDAQGQRIEGMLLQAGDGFKMDSAGSLCVTETAEACVVSAQVLVSASHVYVIIDEPAARSTEQDYETRLARYERLMGADGVKPYYAVPLQPGVGVYQLDVAPVPTTTATGSIVGGSGQLKDWSIFATEVRNEYNPNPQCNFSVSGVRAGVATSLFLLDRVTSRVVEKRIEPPFTTPSHPAGSFEVPALDTTGRLNLKLTGLSQVPKLYFRTREHAVLVGRDNSRIYWFRIGLDGKVASLEGNATEVRLAPGRYYVCPGLLITSQAARLVQLVKSGRQTDLDAAGVPVVSAGTKEAEEVELAVGDSWTKIEKLE